MDFMIGYALAFLKVCALGVAIMVPVWVLTRYIEARGRAAAEAEAADGDDRRP